MKLHIILFVITLFAGHLLFAQEDTTAVLSLDDAISTGLKNNYQIQISEADVQIAENNNTAGNAGMLPTVTAGVYQGNRFDNTESQVTAGERDDVLSNSLRPNANVQMILFNGFRIRTVKKNLALSEKSAELSMRLTFENTLSEIINAYYGVQLEYEKLEVMKELTQLSKDRYQYVLARKEIGTAVTYDVLQVKNAFLQDSSNYLSQKSAYKTSKRRLSIALGDTSFTDFTLTDSLQATEQSFEFSELNNQLLQKNTSLQLSRLSNELSENSLKIAQSSLYPSLSLNGGTDYTKSWVKYNDRDYTDSYSYDFYANLSLSYTIFNGGNRTRQITNARIEKRQSELQTQDLQLTLKSSLYALYDMYEVRKQILRVSKENLEAAKLNLEISKDKFNRGAINSFNYRDVQINYINAAYSNLQAEYSLIAVSTDLLKITGNLVQGEE
ncbi:MAG: TolC family protein [Bacteroidota bacterium]|nr:TolC family protein [Bacteroidota bacterium]